MALAALHLLGHVKSTWAAAFRGLYALAVDDAGRRRRLAPDGLTRAPDETAIDAMPSPVVPPTVEVALHGRARRKFSPERPPLTAGSKNVKNGIHYGSQIRRSWASYSSRRRHQRLQQRLMLGCGPFWRCDRCHRLHAFALARHHQTQAIIAKRLGPVRMPDHARKPRHIGRKSRLTLV